MDQPKTDPVFSPALCRAARGYLGWTQEDLATHSLVSRSTIRDFEGQRHGMHRSTEAQLRLAFEKAGLRFTNADGCPGLCCCSSATA
ncbi:MAG: transcriptional regulator [Allorhizobium sp.]